MSLQRNIVENIVVICMILLSIFIGVVCFNYDLIIAGLIIVISFSIMSLCVLLLKLQRHKIIDEQQFMVRGSLLKKFKCNCAYISYDNISHSYSDGYIVFYDNGVTYECNGEESIDYISYNDISQLKSSDMQLSMCINSENVISNLSLTSDSALRIKMIISYLSKHGINCDDVTFE